MTQNNNADDKVKRERNISMYRNLIFQLAFLIPMTMWYNI